MRYSADFIREQAESLSHMEKLPKGSGNLSLPAGRRFRAPIIFVWAAVQTGYADA